MGSSFGPSQPNFAVFDNFIHEPSYLTGMIAGAATESNIIGMVGGYAIPEVNRLMHAFMDGAREVNPTSSSWCPSSTPGTIRRAPRKRRSP
jgi:basic membrane protein A and related proteins